MDRSGFSVLEELRGLDVSSPNFGNKLCDILYRTEYLQCVSDLKDEDLVWLVNYLDTALCSLSHPDNPPSRKCLKELRRICGSCGILPTPYQLQGLVTESAYFDFGGFSEVYRGTLNGSTVCVKRLRVYGGAPEEALKAFCHEAVIWKHLAHPNILPLLGVTIHPLLQLASNLMSGNLPEYIRNHPDTNRVRLLSEVAEGLRYLHSRDVIHGDLKGSNILVDDSGHVCIADFGLALVTKNPLSVPSAPYHSCTTPHWAAPEVLNKGNYGKEADIFSFAMVIVEAFTGGVPFGTNNYITAAVSIIHRKRPQRPVHPFFAEGLWSLTQRCWDHNPDSRPKALEVLQTLLTLDIPAWKQLTTRALPTEVYVFLVTTIFSDLNQTRIVENLTGDDIETFIDKMDNVLDILEQPIREKCLDYLSRVCDHPALLPRSLKISLCYDPAKDPVLRNGSVGIWNGQHQGNDVIAHVIRVLPGKDTEQIGKMFCREVIAWRGLRHPNVLPLLGVVNPLGWFVTVSKSGRGNIREFTQADPTVNRFWFLGGATEGLIYLHERGIIHGDLNGANILIDSDDRARLTGFTLAKIASITRYAQPVDNTVPWKSPELLFPVKFGLSKGHPTKESDYYALGMVIYEVLSGQRPFAFVTDCDLQVAPMVFGGERPLRPRGAEGKWFTNEIWEVLEQCWQQQPGDRLGAKGVLAALQRIPPPPALLIAHDNRGPSWGGSVLVDGVKQFLRR